MSIVQAHNVSICYPKGNFKDIGLKEYLLRKINGTYHIEYFWADKDINFALEKGDMLGIIGTNGAGKSTLLKAISGVMEPTKGYVSHKGSISSLLELGGGFDGNMTVRENTFLRGAFLGYTRQFMVEKYDEIIAFAELEEFQDYLFTELSTGMRSRLAFSIVSLLQPDILILDEVLSVGDGAFKKRAKRKCCKSSTAEQPPYWSVTVSIRYKNSAIKSSGSTAVTKSPSPKMSRVPVRNILNFYKGTGKPPRFLILTSL